MKTLIALITVILGSSTSALAAWQFGFSGGFSPNYQVKMDGKGTNSGTPYTTDYKLEYESSFEFGIDIWNTPENSLGFISGLQFGTERKLKSGTINGFPISTSSNISKYQTDFLYIGVAYRWESFYIPLALTYGMSKFTAATPMDSIELKNGFGAHFGIGWFIGDHFVIEYIGRAVTTELNVTSGSASEKNTGTIATALLNFKYLFGGKPSKYRDDNLSL
ncbi:hypothetical protein [Bdellovibrio bacteriovorus]|uniref:hypothetical protein n=1 Tax=Bdellovibrio TaxID=958 RepID=UPI0035A94A95